MSAAKPNCRVCVSAQVGWIDGKLREGTSDRMVVFGLDQRAKKHPTGVIVFSRDAVRDHRKFCLGIIREDRSGQHPLPAPEAGGEEGGDSGEPSGTGGGVEYTAPDDIKLPGVRTKPAARPDLIPPLSDAELADPVARANMIARALYHPSKLNEMSAKDLLALHQNEVRLAEAAAKLRGEAPASSGSAEGEPSDLDEAMAQAAGHRPDLRVVRGKKGA